MKMSEEIKQMLDENLVYLATSTKEGKPNVVPIGLASAISDEELIIVDVMFNKTRANLENNPKVAISFTDVNRWESYQLKGTAKIYAEGDLFDKAKEIRTEKAKRRMGRFHEQTINPVLKEKAQRMKEWRQKLKPKAVVLITVDEIYSHMPKFSNLSNGK